MVSLNWCGFSAVETLRRATDLALHGHRNGFGAFSLGMSQKARAIHYLRRQQEKHGVVSYQDEFRGFLDASEIEYDERYV